MIVTKAILFDLDGTLVDTTNMVERIWLEWAIKHDLDEQAIFAEMHGTRGEYIINKFAPHLDTEAELAALLIREEALSGQVTAIPGAKEMLENLNGAPWGIVTMSSKKMALKKLQIAGLPVPSVLVTADDVKQSKPDPAPYLKGALWLDIAPAECFVFEDAKAGIDSAINAGMLVAQVLHCGHSKTIDSAFKSFDNWHDLDIQSNNSHISIR